MFFLIPVPPLVIGSFTHDCLTYLLPIIPTHPICFHVTLPSSSSLSASRTATVTVYYLSVKPGPTSVQASCPNSSHPTLCRHPFHFSLVIVCKSVVSGLLVQSAAGNFLLIIHRTIPCIPGMLPGTTGGPARCEGVCNTRQTRRPTDTIHASSGDLLMRMGSVIDEERGWAARVEREKREGEDSGGGGVMVMCVNSAPKIENSE